MITPTGFPASRTGGWVLAGTQAGFALGLAGAAVVAHHHTGADGTSRAVMLLGEAAWLAVMLAGLSVIASGLLLAFGYAKGRPALLAALLAGTVIAVGTVAVGVSPAGLSVLGRLLD